MRITKVLVSLIAVAGLLPSAQTSEAAFLGGEGLIAFESTRTGNREVFVVREDGSGLANLTDHPSADGDPVWNADGDKLAFTSQRDGHTDIWVMNADGTVVGNMTPGGITGLAPAWSPDSAEIAYIYNHDLWVVAADGSGTIRNISDSPDVQESEPTWAPDGSVIAYRRRSPEATDIWTVQPDGSNPANITQTPPAEADERKPSYTGDGSAIVYERFSDIWKMSADGTAQTNLTSDFSGGGRDPSASPSGERIVFTSSADNNEELFVMNADGTNITRLTIAEGEDENPDWQATDPPPGLSIRDAVASEEADEPSSATFIVSLSAASEIPVSIRYETRDGTAKQDLDYTATDGTLGFAPGETEKSVDVAVLSDSVPEREERFKVRLLDPEGARVVRGTAAGIIVEAADVSVDISDSKDPVRNNGRFVYTVEVSNAGPSSASDTRLHLAISRSVELETARIGDKACDVDPPRVTCPLGKLRSGDTKTITIKVTAGPASQTIYSEVHIGAAESDPLPSNNYDGETTEISPRAPQSLTAALDTYVPPRFTDVDSDGYIDETFNTPEDMDQPFLIRFHACDSGPSEDIVQYSLEITVGSETTTQTSASCEFDTPGGLHFNPPDEGAYPIKLTVTTAGGQTDVLEKNVRFTDHFVVSLGDSVASGEGNPDKPCSTCTSCITGPICTIDLRWENGRCHRSADAGSAQAARMLESSSSLSSVTFVHLACSGSSIENGILNPYPGIDDEVVGHPYFGTELEPQMDIVEEMMDVSGRMPDAIIISGGANDARFGHLVERCLGFDKCHLDDAFRDEVTALMAALPDRYRELDERLDAMEVPSDRIFFTEYFDPTRDETGNFGRCMTTEFLVGSVSLVSAAEWEWAYHNVIRALNRRVFAGTESHDWNYVGGIESAFKKHGYCSKDPWVRSIPESLLFQAGIHGSFHPNLEGHVRYANRIYDKLSRTLR